jgi:hypothetical protein
MNLYSASATLAALVGSSVVVTFQLLPERIDLFGFVLQGAGLGALGATAFAVIRGAGRSRRARWVELGNAGGAALALVIFVGIALIQGVS